MRSILLVFLSFWAACTPAVITRSYKTPEETFETWRQAAERLDFETLIACYAASARPGVRKDIAATSEEGLRAMRDETRKTKFKIEKIVYEKDKAYLRTSRRIPGGDDIEVLVMIKEGQDWRLVP